MVKGFEPVVIFEKMHMNSTPFFNFSNRIAAFLFISFIYSGSSYGQQVDVGDDNLQDNLSVLWQKLISAEYHDHSGRSSVKVDVIYTPGQDLPMDSDRLAYLTLDVARIYRKCVMAPENIDVDTILINFKEYSWLGRSYRSSYTLSEIDKDTANVERMLLSLTSLCSDSAINLIYPNAIVSLQYVKPSIYAAHPDYFPAQARLFAKIAARRIIREDRRFKEIALVVLGCGKPHIFSSGYSHSRQFMKDLDKY